MNKLNIILIVYATQSHENAMHSTNLPLSLNKARLEYELDHAKHVFFGETTQLRLSRSC